MGCKSAHRISGARYADCAFRPFFGKAFILPIGADMIRLFGTNIANGVQHAFEAISVNQCFECLLFKRVHVSNPRVRRDPHKRRTDIRAPCPQASTDWVDGKSDRADCAGCVSTMLAGRNGRAGPRNRSRIHHDTCCVLSRFIPAKGARATRRYKPRKRKMPYPFR